MIAKKNLALIMCLLNGLLINAQTPNFWIIGGGGGVVGAGNNFMDFTSGVLSVINPITNPQNPFLTTNAQIAQKDSSLLYYSNGVQVYNRLHQLMPGGDTLSPNAFTFMHLNSGSQMPQAVVFIPFPSGEKKHFLFHESWNLNYGGSCYTLAGAGAMDAIYYTVIDDTLNNGLGGIESKNNILLADSFGHSLIVVKHGNGRDWWLLAHLNSKPEWYSWLISPQGIQPPIIQNVGPQVCYGYRALKFSAAANKIAGMRTYFVHPNSRYLDLFDFDRCSGIISNHELLTQKNYTIYSWSGGCEVSSSGQYLYVGAMNYLYQYDLLAANIAASVIVVDSTDSVYPAASPYTNWSYPMQLAPDGKIYASCNCTYNNALSVINSPDLPGLACNAMDGAISLPNFANSTIPYIPQYELGPTLGSVCDTLTALPPQPINTTVLSIYPNPASTQLTINCPQLRIGQSITVKVSDVLGQEVLSEIMQYKVPFQLTVAALSPGLYIIQVQQNNFNGIVRFVK